MLKAHSKNLQGIVLEGRYSGTNNATSHRSLLLETDTGEIIQLPAHELEKVGQPIQQPLFK